MGRDGRPASGAGVAGRSGVEGQLQSRRRPAVDGDEPAAAGQRDVQRAPVAPAGDESSDLSRLSATPASPVAMSATHAATSRARCDPPVVRSWLARSRGAAAVMLSKSCATSMCSAARRSSSSVRAVPSR